MSHRMESSLAFLRIPDRRLEYVTCLPLLFSSLLIFSFTLPIAETTRLVRGAAAAAAPPRDHTDHRRRRRSLYVPIPTDRRALPERIQHQQAIGLRELNN